MTPGHFVPQIVKALDQARKEGLTLPVVYNTSSYETVDTIKMLEGYVDIYLPDFKYMSPVLSKSILMLRIMQRLQRQRSQRWCGRQERLCL